MLNARRVLLPVTILASLSVFGIERPERIASDACVSCHQGAMGHDSHPVRVQYERAAAMRTNLRRGNDRSGLGRTIADDLLVDGRVECTSCHDSHERESEMWKRLRVAEDSEYARAALCRGCHVVD